MSNLKKVLSALAAAGLIAAAAPAQAIPTLTLVTDQGTQVVDPFTGIDWVNTASAVTTGFNTGLGVGVYGSTFTTSYAASAIAINQGAGIADLVGMTANGITAPATRWELTVVATIKEQAACADALCSAFDFKAVSGGTFDIYYGRDANSNRLTGAGFADGIHIIGGLINAGSAGSFDGNTDTGNFTYSGVVNFTEINALLDAFINPELTSTDATATLQFGSKVVDGWTAPTAWAPLGIASTAADPTLIIFNADGNQSFAVPEPGSLALIGLGLLGLVGGAKRRNCKA